MPATTFPVMLALAIVVTLGSLIYLLINARGVAQLFRGAGLEPGPGRTRASRGAIILALLAFNLGWIACVAIYAFGAG